jgi:hypothetical protein
MVKPPSTLTDFRDLGRLRVMAERGPAITDASGEEGGLESCRSGRG